MDDQLVIHFHLRMNTNNLDAFSLFSPKTFKG